MLNSSTTRIRPIVIYDDMLSPHSHSSIHHAAEEIGIYITGELTVKEAIRLQNRTGISYNKLIQQWNEEERNNG